MERGAGNWGWGRKWVWGLGACRCRHGGRGEVKDNLGRGLWGSGPGKGEVWGLQGRVNGGSGTIWGGGAGGGGSRSGKKGGGTGEGGSESFKGGSLGRGGRCEFGGGSRCPPRPPPQRCHGNRALRFRASADNGGVGGGLWGGSWGSPVGVWGWGALGVAGGAWLKFWEWGVRGGFGEGDAIDFGGGRVGDNGDTRGGHRRVSGSPLQIPRAPPPLQVSGKEGSRRGGPRGAKEPLVLQVLRRSPRGCPLPHPTGIPPPPPPWGGPAPPPPIVGGALVDSGTQTDISFESRLGGAEP